VKEKDCFAVAVERVVTAGQRACVAIEKATKELESRRDAQREGVLLAEVVDELIGGGGRTTRLGAAEAFRDYERAIASMRAAVVRGLVDDEGLSLSDVASRMRISRQAVARLYRLQDPAAPEKDSGLI
jgi:hypothetical protein